MDAIGDPTEDSTPFNFTLSTLKPRIRCDGTYILKVTDAAGNEAKQNMSIRVLPDVPVLVLPKMIINPNTTIIVGRTSLLDLVRNTVTIGTTFVKVNADGTFVIPALPDRAYPVVVTDPDGNINSGVITAVTSGPLLTLPTNPINPITSNIMGQTFPGSVAVINSQTINVDRNGSFILPKDLDSGTYTVSSRDQDGNQTFGTFSVKITPPALTIANSTPNREEGLSGSTDIGATVVVGNQSVFVDSDGKFTLPVLEKGIHFVKATDLAGNQTTKSIKTSG